MIFVHPAARKDSAADRPTTPVAPVMSTCLPESDSRRRRLPRSSGIDTAAATPNATQTSGCVAVMAAHLLRAAMRTKQGRWKS